MLFIQGRCGINLPLSLTFKELHFTCVLKQINVTLLWYQSCHAHFIIFLVDKKSYSTRFTVSSCFTLSQIYFSISTLSVKLLQTEWKVCFLVWGVWLCWFVSWTVWGFLFMVSVKRFCHVVCEFTRCFFGFFVFFLPLKKKNLSIYEQ